MGAVWGSCGLDNLAKRGDGMTFGGKVCGDDVGMVCLRKVSEGVSDMDGLRRGGSEGG